MPRIAIAGASGRMGHMLIEAVLASSDCTLSGALDIPGSSALGQDAGAFLGRATGVAITADLHAVSHAPATASPVPLAGGVPAVGHASSTAILGDRKRRGVWQVPAQHSAFTLMGSITLDLREAVLTARETTINANAIMGEIKIIIPAHMHAVVDGTPIMGDYGQGKDKVPADLRPESPTIRVKGVALMGSVQVVRLPPPGTPRKFIGTY